MGLRVIEVNTLEPRLKTLTPWQTLTSKGLAGGQVKLYGRDSEVLRDAGVMRFRGLGEAMRDR
jgi:hypothetical protein